MPAAPGTQTVAVEKTNKYFPNPPGTYYIGY